MQENKECTEDEFYKSLYAEFAQADKEEHKKNNLTSNYAQFMTKLSGINKVR